MHSYVRTKIYFVIINKIRMENEECFKVLASNDSEGNENDREFQQR